MKTKYFGGGGGRFCAVETLANYMYNVEQNYDSFNWLNDIPKQIILK